MNIYWGSFHSLVNFLCARACGQPVLHTLRLASTALSCRSLKCIQVGDGCIDVIAWFSLSAVPSTAFTFTEMHTSG